MCAKKSKIRMTWNRYVRNKIATIAVAFAIMAPVVVGSAGMALDFAQAYLVQQRLAQAIDAAALAATASSNDPVEIKRKIKDFFDANYPADKLGVTFTPEVEVVGNQIRVSGYAQYNTFFLPVIGINEIEVSATNQVTRIIGSNIELALVLDISGSMANNNKITDLKAAAKDLIDIIVYENQKDYYSKVAIVPYSMAVNAGTYATQVRGPIAAAKSITAATKANPVVITSNAHGFNNGDKVYITGVSGMTQLNNKIYTVAGKTANTFQLSGIDGRSYTTFKTPAGSVYCTTPGCQYYYFANPSNVYNTFPVTTCVSERTGANAYTDASPSTAYVGRNYPPTSNPCLSNKILPLTNDKDVLDDNIDALVATGSTGGQVGVGWGWYMLSPNWTIWPVDSIPAAYGAEHLHKIVVLMTDGEYNSPYCNGVISKDATSGSGNTADHINCNATNGNSYTQAETMCDAMKAPGKDIEVYTIGFRVDDYPRGEQLMEYCATDETHFYTADNGDELRQAFRAIANNVSSLYLSK